VHAAGLEQEGVALADGLLFAVADGNAAAVQT